MKVNITKTKVTGGQITQHAERIARYALHIMGDKNSNTPEKCPNLMSVTPLFEGSETKLENPS